MAEPIEMPLEFRTRVGRENGYQSTRHMVNSSPVNSSPVNSSLLLLLTSCTAFTRRVNISVKSPVGKSKVDTSVKIAKGRYFSGVMWNRR